MFRLIRRPTSWRTVVWLIVIFGMIGAAYYFGFYGGIRGTTSTYDGVKGQIQDAVTAYQARHDGQLPALNRTVTVNGSAYRVIDMCALAYRGELLPVVPDGCARDNCVSGRCTCTEGSYIWVVDDGGNVSSTCIALECDAYQTDGEQGVWP